MHKIRKLKYYQDRARQIRLILSQDGLDPDYCIMLKNALWLCEWRIRQEVRKETTRTPIIN